MDDEHVIARIDGNSDGRAKHPMIRERLRPHRIDFEARHLDRGKARNGGLEFGLSDEKTRDERAKRTRDNDPATMHVDAPHSRISPQMRTILRPAPSRRLAAVALVAAAALCGSPSAA